MNVFQYGAITEKNWEMNLADMSGYQRKYTFYSDFSIAEFCEVYANDRNAVKTTYNNVVSSWGSDIKAMTEVAMVLNHKSWSFSANVDSSYLKCGEDWREKFQQIYTDLYYKVCDFINKKFKDDKDALEYFYITTD